MGRPVQADEPIPGSRDLGPMDGGNTIFAAWDYFYWIFGARSERIEIVPEGVVLRGFAFGYGLDTDRILADLAKVGTHRLNFVPLYFWANGNMPEAPTSGDAISDFGAKWFGGTGDGGKNSIPEYVKMRFAAYKEEHGLNRRSRIEPFDITKADPKMLEGFTADELMTFEAFVREQINARQLNAAAHA